MTSVRSLPRLLAAAACATLLAGCTESGGVLNDDATCPGESCTEDTQARFDAIARLDEVTAVESVSRSYGFDRGSSRSAEVAASVDTADAARDVGLAVLTELEDWPEHSDGSAVVVVRADSGSPVPQSYVDRQPMLPDFYEPCAPARCDAAVADLEELLTAEVDGLEELSAAVSGGRLSITATATAVPAARAVKAILDRVETDLDAHVGDRVEVRIDYVAPIEVTLRLDEGLVCEQPPGLIVGCDDDNSEPFPQ